MKADSMTGKVAIVTGAARGIGREIVRELISGGARVYALDINEKAFEGIEQDVGSADGQLIRKLQDVTNAEKFTALV